MKKLRRALAVLLTLCLILAVVSSGFAAMPGEITVTEIQKYGNLVLSVKGSELLSEFAYGDLITVTVNGKDYEMPVGNSYSDVDTGEDVCRAVYDKDTGDDYVIIAINMGDFATTAGIATKTKIEEAPGYRWDYNEGVEVPVKVAIAMKEAGGYYDEWIIHQLKRTNNREDYPHLNDSEFANFRNIATDGMGANMLYRTSSPINPEIGRNTYADAALRGAAVKTVVNLANSDATMKEYEGYADTYYSTLNVIGLNLGVDFTAADFQTGLAAGMRYMIAHDGPYAVHCTEGKDRAGFVSALLECLMGATAEQVIADYMITYYNYYGVEKDTDKYTAIANSNIKKSLATAFGVADITAEGTDLAALAQTYFTDKLGLTTEEVTALKAQLAKNNSYTIKGLEKYGHIDVNITAEEFLKRFDYGDILTVTVNGHSFDMPVCSDYTDVKTGALLIRVVDGKDYIILAINYGKIAVEAGIGYYDEETKTFLFNEGKDKETVTFELKEKGGYRAQWESHHLTRTDVREDYLYLSDEGFANYRNIETTGMGTFALYRSSSPVNPEIGRNTYADTAAKADGVRTFINLADTEEEMLGREGFEKTYYSTQDYIALGLMADFTDPKFSEGLAEGMRFIATHDGPYLVHCNEGKDRAGIAAALLESLMGATADEVIDDYMTTYYNYYAVDATDARYDIIAEDNIITNLNILFKLGEGKSITDEGTDMAALANVYFTETLKLTEEEVAQIKTNLGKAWSKFIDVDSDVWYTPYVVAMTKMGLVNGVTETTFAPLHNLTRGQLVTILYRSADRPEVKEASTFTDVPAGSYYADAIAWAQDEKIVNGVTETLFAPDQMITREQLATILYRYAEADAETVDLKDFVDTDEISAWAKDAVMWAVKNGLLSGKTLVGTGDTLYLDPLGNATRAEACKLLCVFVDLLYDQTV